MKLYSITFFLFITVSGFAQSSEKKILFRGDSLWYAAKDNLLFSSADKGENWDTIYGKKNMNDTVFFYGAFDTTSNVFISDQRTIFVFGWDGTMHFKTILYSSSDCGKTWSKIKIIAENGVLGVHYFHKISANRFMLDCRFGTYMSSNNCGKTWKENKLTNEFNGCRDEQFIFHKNGEITYSYYSDKNCVNRVNIISQDGGWDWGLAK